MMHATMHEAHTKIKSLSSVHFGMQFSMRLYWACLKSHFVDRENSKILGAEINSGNISINLRNCMRGDNVCGVRSNKHRLVRSKETFLFALRHRVNRKEYL